MTLGIGFYERQAVKNERRLLKQKNHKCPALYLNIHVSMKDPIVTTLFLLRKVMNWKVCLVLLQNMFHVIGKMMS